MSNPPIRKVTMNRHARSYSTAETRTMSVSIVDAPWNETPMPCRVMHDSPPDTAAAATPSPFGAGAFSGDE